MVNHTFDGSNADLSEFTNDNGTLYFVANDGTHGYELWKTDGTTLGIGRVADINPGSGSLSPEYLANVNGALYFIANDGSDGSELWILT